MTDFKMLCDQVVEIARKAAEYISIERETFSPDFVEMKGEHNPVSFVDKNAEKLIVDRLAGILPDSGFITEEGQGSDSGERLRWIIDPLDGTTNFIHGLAPYCVSIALMDENEIVLGVVHEVASGETFYAWKGSQAYLDGKIITASAVQNMEKALIAIGFSYGAPEGEEGFFDKIRWYQRHTDGVRRIGSAAADLVYVACGRLDGFAQSGLSSWDVAAGAFIARCAGAVVSDNSGGENYIFGREVVAAAPGIFSEFLKTV